MAMTMTEATAVNTILEYFLQITTPSGVVDEERAQLAAAWLADRALAVLMGGVDSHRVYAAWPHRRGTPPLGESAVARPAGG